MLLASGVFIVDKDDPPSDILRKLLLDNQIDLTVAEGLRLITAFEKISDPSDRRVLIALAERLGR